MTPSLRPKQLDTFIINTCWGSILAVAALDTNHALLLQFARYHCKYHYVVQWSDVTIVEIVPQLA